MDDLLAPTSETPSSEGLASAEVAEALPSPAPAKTSQRIDTHFPERFVDQLSRQEVFNKHLFRPNTYLHKWWARRCGSTFRTILKQFASSTEGTDYYAAGGLEGLTVLDPMMGGGTTLHETIRLGANVIGADIDPIPVIQARASLSRTQLPTLRAAFNRFFADLHADLHPHFQTHCPTCATQTATASTECANGADAEPLFKSSSTNCGRATMRPSVLTQAAAGYAPAHSLLIRQIREQAPRV